MSKVWWWRQPCPDDVPGVWQDALLAQLLLPDRTGLHDRRCSHCPLSYLRLGNRDLSQVRQGIRLSLIIVLQARCYQSMKWVHGLLFIWVCQSWSPILLKQVRFYTNLDLFIRFLLNRVEDLIFKLSHLQGSWLSDPVTFWQNEGMFLRSALFGYLWRNRPRPEASLH